MNDREFKITDAVSGVAIGVRVVTRATATELVGKNEDNTLKIRLKEAPAGSDSANAELIDFLAQALSVDANKIEIVAGEGSRDKILSIEGLTTEQVEERLGIS